jgi:hypothetical protein
MWAPSKAIRSSSACPSTCSRLATVHQVALLLIAQTWVVFPAFSEHPPPNDPTMMRLTKEVRKVMRSTVDGKVRLAKIEERDSCPGKCPSEIASMLSVEHVVSLHLSDGYDQLAILVHEPSHAPAIRKVACTYGNGLVSCDDKQVAEAFGKKRGGLDDKAVKKAFESLRPKLLECGFQEPGIEASVRFRVRPDGRATDVRIDPERVQNQKPYDCMARVVESLRVPPFEGEKPVAFQLAIPKPK